MAGQTATSGLTERRSGTVAALWQSLTDGDRPFRMGLLAGLALLYVGIIGMIEAFNQREVIRNVLTLGQLLLFIPSLLGGYAITRRLSQTRGFRPAVLGGAAVGLIAAIPTLLMLAINASQDVSDVFVNINRDWIEIVTFDNRNDLLLGGLFLLGVLGLAGLIGGVWSQVPDRMRKSLIFGVSLMLVVGVMGETVRLVLQEVFTRDFLDNFFRRDTMLLPTAIGLLVGGTVISYMPRPIWRSLIFGLVAAIAVVGLRNMIQAIPGAPTLPASEQGTLDAVIYFILPLVIATAARLYWEYGRGASSGTRIINQSAQPARQIRAEYVAVIVILLVIPWLVGRALSDVMVTIGLFALMGLGLNIAIGLAGLLDLGYVTNYAVGAYVMAVLTSTGPLGRGPEFMSFWLVIPIALLAAMFAGFFFAVPVLKMRGDYLAIATLGFGEIIGRLAISDALAPVIGGAQGVLFVPKPNFFGTELKDPEQLYYVILAACVVTLLVSIRLNNSRTGRQWMAVREDEDVASAMGINVPRAKLLAFTLSAATGGVAGAIFAAKVGTVFPNSFTVFISINVLSLIIVGGIGSNPGIIIGAIVLIGLPELLREFSEFRWLMYGALLIWMMINRPEGLWPSQARKREMRSGPEPIPAHPTQAQAAD